MVFVTAQSNEAEAAAEKKEVSGKIIIIQLARGYIYFFEHLGQSLRGDNAGRGRIYVALMFQGMPRMHINLAKETR